MAQSKSQLQAAHSDLHDTFNEALPFAHWLPGHVGKIVGEKLKFVGVTADGLSTVYGGTSVWLKITPKSQQLTLGGKANPEINCTLSVPDGEFDHDDSTELLAIATAARLVAKGQPNPLIATGDTVDALQPLTTEDVALAL